jgi:polyisoprenoid-binding protein YceI
MATIRRSATFQATLEGSPDFFLTFAKDAVSAKAPAPLENDILVHPTGGYLRPVTFESPYQDGSSLFGRVKIVPGTVNYDPATKSYPAAHVTVDTKDLGTDNGKPFSIEVIGWGDDSPIV